MRGTIPVSLSFSFSPFHTSFSSVTMSSIPQLGFWEKADLPFAHLSIFASVLYHAITGVFRGKASPKRYDHHIMTAMIRKLLDRTSDRQKQYA